MGFNKTIGIGISTAIDNKEFSLGVFIDITKAFDTVNHSILLYKMKRLGVRGLALSWLRSYLSERYQQVPTVMGLYLHQD